MRISCKPARLAVMAGILATLFGPALVLALAAPSSAERMTAKLDRFKLWNGCKPVGLIVSGLSSGANALGLRKKAVEAAVRARLRGARIYQESWNPYLNVRIAVARSAATVTFDFLRPVKVILPFRINPKKALPVGFASTWTRGSLGSGEVTPQSVLSAVSGHADTFIDEYLRVNADACK
ncbi:MAG: hypothetical protein OXE86_04530 [Alphaproteobacteria bacterium]|nr:hypothetical protein [Alphaproteobacteria bacterium]